MSTMTVLGEVVEERIRQDEKWGVQDYPMGTGDRPGLSLAEAVAHADEMRRTCDEAFTLGVGTWLHILDEEVAEASAESDPEKLRAELLQVAAVAVAMVEALDRRGAR